MARKITNEVLYEKILNINDNMTEVKEHLKNLNGQVAKNTAAREQQGVINKVATFIVVTIVGFAVWLIQKLW